MKIYLLFVQCLLIWVAAGVPLRSQTPAESPYSVHVKADGTVVIEDFEDDEIGRLPHRWYNRDGKRQPINYPDDERASYRYRVQEEHGNRFLHYEGTSAKHINFPLIDKEQIDIFETPVLSWRWRVSELPAGADEGDNSRNDSAASLYVVFDMGRVALFKKVPKSIRYTWSTTLEEGTELSEFFGNQKIVVVKSGPEGLGTWHTFERNIVEDYRRLFGDDPPGKPLAILILSDGNSTGHRAEGDYDDIELHPDR